MIIKHFNVGGDLREEATHPHASKVSNLILDDIDLTAITIHQYNDMKTHWTQTGTKTEVLTILVPDYFDLPSSAFTGVQPTSSSPKQFTIQINPSISISDFKRILLCFLENRPFFLQLNLNNNQSVANLL